MPRIYPLPSQADLRPAREIEALPFIERLEAIGREMFGPRDMGPGSWPQQLALRLHVTSRWISGLRKGKAPSPLLEGSLLTAWKLWRKRLVHSRRDARRNAERADKRRQLARLIEERSGNPVDTRRPKGT